MKKVVAYTAVCEEDSHYISQYLAEVERVDVPFAIHLDRCSEATKNKLINHRLCVGYTSQDDPDLEFDETHKQAVFDLVVKSDADWALAWDIDETWEKRAPEKMAEIRERSCHAVDTLWKNLWNDPQHIRVDGPFAQGHRIKFRALKTKFNYRFYCKVINGAKAFIGGVPANNQLYRREKSDLVCVHWGLMTRSGRLLHKVRWDRIYTASVGENPYGIWNYACNEEEYPPTVIEHDYF